MRCCTRGSPPIGGRATCSPILRTAIAATAAAGLAYGASASIGGGHVAGRFGGQLLQVVVGVAVGAGAYVLLASLLRIPEVELLQRLNPARRRERTA